MCQCCHRYQIAVHATLLYGCTAVLVNKVKLWNQPHVLFCSFAIKETDFVLILVAHSLQFSEVAAATTNMTDLSRHEYDWRLRLSRINMIDSDLTKYDWRRRVTWWRRLRGLLYGLWKLIKLFLRFFIWKWHDNTVENVIKYLLHLEVYQIASLHCALWNNNNK